MGLHQQTIGSGLWQRSTGVVSDDGADIVPGLLQCIGSDTRQGSMRSG